MQDILIVVFGLLCAGMLLWGVLAPGRTCEFPFLAGATWGGFVLPQLIGLRSDSTLPSEGLEKTTLMGLLCAAACCAGYALGGQAARGVPIQLNGRRLLIASTMLTGIGLTFYAVLGQLPEEELASPQWTGRPVALKFFASVVRYGFVLAVLLFVHTHNKWALLVAGCAALFYLDRIVYGGRRASLVEFVLVLIGTCWFGRRKGVHWSIALVGIGVLAVFVFGVGTYRSHVVRSHDVNWKEVVSADYTLGIRDVVAQGAPELRNAVFSVAARDHTREFDYGVWHWNAMVFAYVPAQLVGEDTKASLMLSLPDDAMRLYHYSPIPGSTQTGIVDAFQSLWYFGFLKFVLVGFIVRRIYVAAMAGSFVAQAIYLLVLTQALHAITHSTNSFAVPWIHMGMFLLPCILFARTRTVGERNKTHVDADVRRCREWARVGMQ